MIDRTSPAASGHAELSAAEILRLHERLADFGGTLDLPELRQEILRTCIVLMGADKGNLQVVDPETGKLTIAAHVGFDPEFLSTFAAIDPTDENHSICTRAAVRRRSVFAHDVLNETEFSAVRRSAASADFRSVQSTPLFGSTGDLIAVVSTHWKEPYQPTAQQEAARDAFLRQAVHFLERRTSDERHRDALSYERVARLAAEDLNRRKDQFIATVAHELRQPLAPMVTALEVMKLRASRENGQRARQVVERQLAQLVRLVEQLMDATRISEGKAPLQNDCVDLREVIAHAIEALEPLVRLKRQTVEFSSPEAAAVVRGDAGRLRQVFSNLLSNASKFSGAASSISVTMSFEDAKVRVDVKDHGRGIAADDLPHIFDIFRQSIAGENGGLGIGLYIVRGLVELHGGTVESQSAGATKGSTFTVRLPRIPERPSARRDSEA